LAPAIKKYHENEMFLQKGGEIKFSARLKTCISIAKKEDLYVLG